jgi:hypothetical protein
MAATLVVLKFDSPEGADKGLEWHKGSRSSTSFS